MGLEFSPDVGGYLAMLERCAMGRDRIMGPLEPEKLRRRFTDQDAALFAAGLRAGLLQVTDDGYLRTADPHQATAWLVEGTPAWPCWEYLPHAASYVELILDLGFPVEAVRFETPGREHGLDADLAVVDGDGRVVILGEAKKESRELDVLTAQLSGYAAGDPGPPRTGDRDKAARKLAHRLWLTRAPWLWLVGPSDRRVFQASYEPLELISQSELPAPSLFDLPSAADPHPLLALPGPDRL